VHLRITVVGSANIDLVATVDVLPRPGETLTAAGFRRFPGGKGANQAVAAARLGADVGFVGRVGTDDLVLRSLEEAGVDLSGVTRDDGETGTAVILVDASGQNVIVVAPEANGRLAPTDVIVPDSDAVICQLEIPPDAVLAASGRARGLFVLNAAPAGPVAAEVVERADLVVVNRHELDALPVQPRRAALTLGAEGAVLLENGVEVRRAAPPRVTAVDGTAAGDAFCAAMVVGMLEGRDDQDALRRACAAGALAASRFGAQPSLPTAAEIDAILAA